MPGDLLMLTVARTCFLQLSSCMCIVWVYHIITVALCDTIPAEPPAVASQLVEQGSLFGGRMPPKLQETNGFQTASMAQIHADNTWLLSDVANVLDTALGVGSWQTTYFERQQVGVS